MLKNQIRKVSSEQRDSLTEEQYQLYNDGLLRQFTLLGFNGVKTVHVFLPITEKKEPNTFLFIEWLEQNHPEIKIIVPKADFETALLTHHEYLGDQDLKKSIYNILAGSENENFWGAWKDRTTIGLEIDLDSIQNVLSSAETPSGFAANDIRKLIMTTENKFAYMHISEGATRMLDGRVSRLTSKLISYLISDFVKTQ